MIFTETEIIRRGHHYNRKLIEKIILDASNPTVKHIVSDCFSGIGGVTAGFYDAPGWKVIVCLNHWDKAIETHIANYPDCLHLEEDFRTADLQIIMYMIDEIKKNNPGVQVHFWGSYECTNFSGAKGGQSRDADSRSLADDADRYVEALNPDVIWVENVREFEWWGPMIPKVISTHLSKKGNIVKNKVVIPKNVDEIDYYNVLIENGRVLSCPMVKEKDEITKAYSWKKWMIPDPYLKGQDYQRWKEHICSYGYDCDRRLLNCADYGVPQHRIRLIMKFVRSGMPISWPKPTHSKTGKNGLPKWLAVGPCLNLEREGESIVAYKKDKKGNIKTGKNGNPVPRIKSPKTIERAMKGCIKHALNGKTTWIMKPNSAKNNTDVSSGSSIDSSSPAVTCYNGLNIAKAHIIDNYFGNGFTKPITEPANVVGTKEGSSLHSIQFIVDYNHSSSSSSIADESKAILAAEKYALGTTYFIGHEYTGDQQKSLQEPCGSLNGIPKQNIVQVDHFVMGTGYNNGDDRSTGINEPSKVITANRKHYYIISSHWFDGNSKGIDSPANTIIARMDKTPPYLIVTEMGDLAIEINDYDPPHYIAMKKFMAENGILAINMRMLEEEELLKIMTLDNHILIASSTDNKKMIGNAVPKKLVTALANDHDSGLKNIRTLFNQAA